MLPSKPYNIRNSCQSVHTAMPLSVAVPLALSVPVHMAVAAAAMTAAAMAFAVVMVVTVYRRIISQFSRDEIIHRRIGIA